MLGGLTLILAGATMIYMAIADVTTRELLGGFLDGQLLVRGELAGMDSPGVGVGTKGTSGSPGVGVGTKGPKSKPPS